MAFTGWCLGGTGWDRSHPVDKIADRAAESESELESVKFRRFRLRPGVAGYYPSTGDDLGRKVTYRLENIERQEKKESGSVEIR